MNEDIKKQLTKLVEKYPNDFDLGSKVREYYWTERDRLYRELLDLPAQQSTTEGTSVTRVETQLELPIDSETTIESKHIGYSF